MFCAALSFYQAARSAIASCQDRLSDEKYLCNVLAIVKEKIKLLKELPEWTAYFFTGDYQFDPAAVEKVFGQPEAATRLSALRDEIAKIDNWNVQQIESHLKMLAEKLGCKTGDLVRPARVAVCGRTVGPILYHMLEVMGKDRVLARFVAWSRSSARNNARRYRCLDFFN